MISLTKKISKILMAFTFLLCACYTTNIVEEIKYEENAHDIVINVYLSKSIRYEYLSISLNDETVLYDEKRFGGDYDRSNFISISLEKDLLEIDKPYVLMFATFDHRFYEFEIKMKDNNIVKVLPLF